MKRSEIVTSIKKFIAQESNLGDESLIKDDIDFFQEGLLDSLMAVSLIAFCQDNFKCDINADEFSEDSLRTINGLTDFIYEKLNK